MGDRRPGHGRYAHIEREQRWLCDAVPAGAEPVCSILDRYIDETRLRLRRSESSEGVVYKLGQKVRAVATDPEMVSLTNIYLSAGEHAALLALPAAELHKTRSHVEWCGRTLAVDRFLGRLAGLVLAEVELAPGDAHLERPPWALRDVTNDDRFSGGTLARASDEAIAELLGQRDRPTR
ncbi:MAG TPA: hypothetical protein VIR58_15425 [Acidimicrobiales bacterium]